MGSLTLIPTKVPRHYFSQENVDKISALVTTQLAPDFNSPYVVDDASIRRVMQRVLEARLEPLPDMFRRVVMEITNEVRTFELERVKHLRYEKFYEFTARIYDVVTRSGPDMQTIKLSRQPATLRFYHTFGTV